MATRNPLVVLALLSLAIAAAPACSPMAPKPTQLTANLVDPLTVNAVSMFNSCVGHPYPSTNSPNSGKNYFWANSTNYGTNDQLKEYAVCSGTLDQTNADTNDPQEFVRGESVHLFCDHSSTALRYFHLNLAASLLGHHVNSGDFLGYGAMAEAGQPPSGSWQNSPSIDIAVSEGDDTHTEDYFAKLDGPSFAAWSVRGVTALSQTINPGNPTCSTWSAYIGDRDILSFSPIR